MSISKTKCKTGNRAFGLVVCKVLGWDIDRLPMILLKGEPSSRILANSSESQLDRFIPKRSAMDYDYAHYMLTEGRKIKENQIVFSPARDTYRMQLAEALNMNRT
ncbi:hypothetical protein V6Z11_A03G019500 [Gossypium hirsutum]